MHRDYLAGNKTEAISLKKNIVDEGAKYGIKTPLYQKINNVLLS